MVIYITIGHCFVWIYLLWLSNHLRNICLSKELYYNKYRIPVIKKWLKINEIDIWWIICPYFNMDCYHLSEAIYQRFTVVMAKKWFQLSLMWLTETILLYHHNFKSNVGSCAKHNLFFYLADCIFWCPWLGEWKNSTYFAKINFFCMWCIHINSINMVSVNKRGKWLPSLTHDTSTFAEILFCD